MWVHPAPLHWREADEVVPVPTYFTLGKNELPSKIQERIVESGGEVVNNLVFLGAHFPSNNSMVCSLMFQVNLRY